MKKRNSWSSYQTTPHLKGETYKIFNKGNNNEIIFRDKQDVQRFMNKFNFYFAPFVVLICYSLLPNHFHLEFRVRNRFKDYSNRYINLDKVINRYKIFSKRVEESIILGELMRRFFMSYAKYYNRKYKREGSLFRKNYKRVLLVTTDDIKRAIVYIHQNAQKHKLINNFRDYVWCSYQIYKNQTKWLMTSGTIFHKLFGDIKSMELAHNNFNNDNNDIQIEY